MNVGAVEALAQTAMVVNCTSRTIAAAQHFVRYWTRPDIRDPQRKRHAGAFLGRETTDVVVFPGGWHLTAVQIRDLAGFIGPATASATAPYIPGGACFLADGARTRSSAASPMCSYLRDSRGGRRRRLCCRAHPSSAANLNPPSGRRCRR